MNEDRATSEDADVLAEDLFDTTAGLAEARHNNIAC